MKATEREMMTAAGLTEKDFRQSREILRLKRLLSETDYKAIKYAEGLLSEEEYAPVKAQRQLWRNQINVLEASSQGTV